MLCHSQPNADMAALYTTRNVSPNDHDMQRAQGLHTPVCSGSDMPILHVELIIVLRAQHARAREATAYLNALHSVSFDFLLQCETLSFASSFILLMQGCRSLQCWPTCHPT